MSNRLQQELLRPRKWFDLSESGDTSDFFIFDVIGSDMWGEGFRAIDFIRQVKDSKSNNINIHINSPGGDAFDGISIYNEMLRCGKKIKTINVGMAASAASIIFMAGAARSMAQGAMAMIHRASTIVWGNSEDLQKKITALDMLDDQMAGIYASASGKDDKKKYRKMMDDETYLDGEQAIGMGFATELAEGQKIAACAWDLKILSGLPERFHRLQNAMNKRDIETVLRDAGWSNAEAKRIASGPREVENDDAGIIAELKKNIEQLKTK
jgi:ATP-dependent Clp protease, protease subunit